MHKDQFDFNIKHPVSIWNRELHFNIKTFTLSLTKSVTDLASQDAQGAAEHLLDGLTGASIQERPAQVAWILIYRSLTQTIEDLSTNYQDLFSAEFNEDEITKFAEELSVALDKLEVGINTDFFTYPKKLSLLDDIKPSLKTWLQNLGMNEHQSVTFHSRIKDSFSLALHQEWINKPKDYACIEQAVTSPFMQSTQEQRERILYNAWLQEQINKRMFNEVFSLKQIYVPLRAYYVEEKPEKNEEDLISATNKTRRVVVDLHSEMLEWTENFNADKTIRVICGGPGSGKSSFGKMFAAEITKKHPEIPTLLIQLHLFNLTDNLISSVEKYIKGDLFLTDKFISTKNGNERLLLIFDGLDELSQQGQAATELAQNFINEVADQISRFNHQGLKYQAIITGRDLSIQCIENRLRNHRQILHTLPFYISEEEIKNHTYVDEKNLLNIDQRINWWEKYSLAKGSSFDKFPTALNTPSLAPLTREPLLNYLVALSYERGEIKFQETTTLNEIYEDLLREIYDRQWEDGRRHKNIKDLTREQFFRILEEIALAVWHGDGRTATANQIIKQCEQSKLKQYLEIFQEGEKKGMTQLLAAFYFRQSEQLLAGEKTFEFTHKSFGEYLTSKRIVRLVRNINKNINLQNEDPESGYDEKEALIKWAELCGPVALDKYISSFITDEIGLSKSESSNWQKTFATLIGYSSRHSLPMEKIIGLTFKEAVKYSRNADESLLAIHHACALQTKKTLKINWGESNAFGAWIKMVHGIRQANEYSVALNSLNGLDLSGSFLDYVNLNDSDLVNSNMKNVSSFKGNFEDSDLSGINFENSDLGFSKFFASSFCNSNLNNAALYFADFNDSEFYDSTLINADLNNASFESAIIHGCTFIGAFLNHASFESASIDDSNFSGADFTEANLSSSTIIDSYLEKANFEMANLYKIKIYNTNLKNSNFNGANLQNSVLENNDLQGATLFNTNLKMAHLKNTDFRGAKLRNANLENANLQNANLENANLENANLKGAYLVNANFKGANLRGAKINTIDFEGANFDEAYLDEAYLTDQAYK